MLEFFESLSGSLLVFAGSAAAIGLAGSKLAAYADRLADRSGLGEAITGTIFLGFLTAVPGLAASVTAAADGYASLAVSNAIGGIAVQTAALAVADIFYTRANLEHAAASAPNIMQAIVLVLLLVLVLVGFSSPEATLGPVHPVSVLLAVAAGCGFWLVFRTQEHPMWSPRRTRDTVADVADTLAKSASLPRLIVGLGWTGAVTAAAGWAAAQSAEVVVSQTGLSESLVGGLFVAGVTSLPELVTSVAAVRRGALTLAVSDIVGGNFFDVLFVSAADLAYREGSIFHAAGGGMGDRFLTAITLSMNVILLMGLVYRQRRGPANIGFESLLMLVIYVSGFVVLWRFF